MSLALQKSIAARRAEAEAGRAFARRWRAERDGPRAYLGPWPIREHRHCGEWRDE